MSQFHGPAPFAPPAALSSPEPMVVQGLDNASLVDHTKDTMSKYWKPTMTPDYSSLFKNWHPDISDVPRDGSFFMGRITGTNKAKAVRWAEEIGKFVTSGYRFEEVEICQWISFVAFADIRSCLWRRM